MAAVATLAGITRVGLGTWAFGGTRWGGQSDRDSIRTIRRAAAAGIGWLDTAGIYGLGHAERVVGRALAGAGQRPLVFTKGGLVWSGDRARRVGDPRTLKRQCEQSLRRLGVEALDLYQLHWPPEDGTPVEEAWGAMDDLVAAGKARRIGVSNFGVDLLERCEAVRHVDAVQVRLSLLERDAAADVIPWARAHGSALIAYQPLAGGLLSGSFSRERRLRGDDWRLRAPAFREPALGAALETVERLRPIAARAGCSVAALAVAWVLAQEGVTGAAVGARSPNQLEVWAGAERVHLDEVAHAVASSSAMRASRRRSSRRRSARASAC
jgi:aryl-alcohol dehydrogenase-like predicted oxidoreductase